MTKAYKNFRYKLTRDIAIRTPPYTGSFQTVGRVGEEVRIVKVNYKTKLLLVQPIRYDKQFYPSTVG